jgi:hypothetical protein
VPGCCDDWCVWGGGEGRRERESSRGWHAVARRDFSRTEACPAPLSRNQLLGVLRTMCMQGQIAAAKEVYEGVVKSLEAPPAPSGPAAMQAAVAADGPAAATQPAATSDAGPRTAAPQQAAAEGKVDAAGAQEAASPAPPKPGVLVLTPQQPQPATLGVGIEAGVTVGLLGVGLSVRVGVDGDHSPKQVPPSLHPPCPPP